MTFASFLVAVLVPPSTLAQQEAPAFAPAVWGLELPVADVQAAARLYSDGLGFRVRSASGEHARLEKDGLALVLVASRAPAAPEGAAAVYLNLEARDLGPALERALAAGFTCDDPEPRAIPIGHALTLRDPQSHAVNLIDLDAQGGAGEDALEVFNVGLDLEEGADWEFVERLGFQVFTRAYLPEALPLARAGAAVLVLHRRARAPRPAGARAAALLLAVERLEPALAALTAQGFADAGGVPRCAPHGRLAALRVPSNLRVELVERSPAQLAFERLADLAGSWEGRSSQGWTSRSEIELIARGSVVLERTNFEAHPGETMLTLFHKDGPDLVLTHYCVAGNQPRLVASAIEGEALSFTFRDATNLPAPGTGHMGSARFVLEGPDAFSSRWSFSQGGQTSWMEEIRYRRLAPAAGTPAAAGAPGCHGAR
ncbi:MAG TPA: VOC family protein [Planctomycetota bacterium]